MTFRVASLDDGTRDGALVVSRAGEDGFRRSRPPYTTLLAALEDWDRFVAGVESGAQLADAALPAAALRTGPALRRTWQALYASAYANRAVRVAQTESSGAAVDVVDAPPLMYQGASDHFLGPGEDFDLRDVADELDFEPEIAVVTGPVPQGVAAADAHRHIRLVVLLNDFTYRALVKRERETRFGFVQGKPPSAMAPIARTPASLGPAWRDGVLHATAIVSRAGAVVGRCPTQGMQYDFAELVAHAAATRPLAAGTLVSSGTVSSPDADGAACLVELRALQRARGDEPAAFLRAGDEVAIDVVDARGRSLFGRLDVRIRAAAPAPTGAPVDVSGEEIA